MPHPGCAWKYICATRSTDGAYAMVYIPASRPFFVDMTKITGGRVKCWWFNPRTGKADAIGEFPSLGRRPFTPPDFGENVDWVLVLDDARKNFPPPGEVKP